MGHEAENTPTVISFHWFFNSSSSKSDKLSYEFQGWEDIDGHRCLRIQLCVDRISACKRYWIDLARDGNVLKYESIMNNKVVNRLDQVTLTQVSTEDRGQVWLPLSGELHSFEWEKEHFDTPVYTTRINLVERTIRVNQHLPDGYFKVRPTDKPIQFPEDDMVLPDFREVKSPLARTDPKGVEKRLDDYLAHADKQAKHLETSAAPSAVREWTTFLPYVFGLFGVCLLVGATVWKLRRS